MFLKLKLKTLAISSLQVLTLRLLRAVLPSWEVGYNSQQQKKLVERLFRLLGEVLVLCSSPFIRPSKAGGSAARRVVFHASIEVWCIMYALEQTYLPKHVLFLPPPDRRRRKVKFHASLTASDSSTVAEEIVVLLRRLHPLDAWNPLINQYISKSLHGIPLLITPSEELLRGKKMARAREDQVSG